MKNLLLLIFGFCALGYSQDNTDAELLLNKVSDNIKSYENVKIKSTADVDGVLNQKNLSIEDGAKLKIKAETY